MRLLLDTHTFLWLDGSPEQLSPAALAVCEDPTNELYLSVVSAWEIQLNDHQLKAGGFKSFRRTSPPTERENG